MKENLQSIKRIINELNYILSNKQKKKSLWCFLIIIGSTLFELLGVSSILPFLEAILTPDILIKKTYMQPVVEIFNIKSPAGLILILGVGLIALYILKNCYMIFAYFIQYSYSTGVQKDLSIKMLKSYMQRPYTYFLDVNSSEIIQGCDADILGVYVILSNLFTMLTEILSVLIIGAYLFFTDIIMAIMVLSLMSVVGLGTVFFLKPLMKRMGKKDRMMRAAKQKLLYQTITGVKELYVMQRKELFIREYERVSDKSRKIQRNRDFFSASPERIIEGICVSGLIAIVLIRLQMGVDKVLFIPQLGAFAMAAFKILPAIGKISNRITAIVFQIPMLDNVYKIISEAKKYEEDLQYKIEYNKEENPDDVRDFQEKLTVSNISWSYNKQAVCVLNNLSIDIIKGESVALIGASGAGKTTLSDVILGLLQPQSGGVYMDGIDVYTIPKSWARIIGYVPQSVFLIDDTIRKNITFGLSQNVDDSLVWKVLEQAQLKGFVKSLPDGLDTIVGERGIKFSGGQRQRIAIARALYNKPQILILDEATSALDNETENAVMEAIETLQGYITLIIVAHRFTTIRKCNKIYEISDGKAILREKGEVIKEAVNV